MRFAAHFVALSLVATFVPGAAVSAVLASSPPGATPAFVAIPAAPAPDLGAFTAHDAIVEQVLEHEVARGETLSSLAARYGVSVAQIAEHNALDARAPLRIGQRISIVSRHVVPPAIDDGIVVNIPQRMLFRFEARRVVAAYPATVGRRGWPTPTGDFTVINRQTDKTWIVPASIQEEMRREGKPVLTEVPPGPENPLGRHWIGTSLPGIGLHGTNAPASVYGFRSHGCVRLHPDDIAALYAATRVGDRGRIVYRPLLLARARDGRIWFEANPDAYRRGPGSLDTVREMARLQSIDERAIDWPRVEAAMTRRAGQAIEVGVVAVNDATVHRGSKELQEVFAR
ncbi:MAG TPA: L,D-transpeptidase family protein [Zeimonas sp.]|nr:L,D-transpeptidase family protein [Zeimonas sp.]